MTPEDLGWNDAFAKEWEACRGTAKGWVPARLIRDNKISYGALTGEGEELEVVMCGKIYHDAKTDAELPAVGDWVALEVGNVDNEHVIRARLPRQNALSRKMSGRSTEEQVIVANIDVAVVVTDAGPDFNLRRMERYFAIIGRSRAKAVVLVNKADLFSAGQNQAAVEAIQELNPEADVHLTSVIK
ncbi:MAG: GTPase RsgA, partial [Verrucomicrobiota bacterium]